MTNFMNVVILLESWLVNSQVNEEGGISYLNIII